MNYATSEFPSVPFHQDILSVPAARKVKNNDLFQLLIIQYWPMKMKKIIIILDTVGKTVMQLKAFFLVTSHGLLTQFVKNSYTSWKSRSLLNVFSSNSYFTAFQPSRTYKRCLEKT